MTIGQLLFGMGIMALIIFWTWSWDDQKIYSREQALGIFLLILSAYMGHDTFGNRLLPQPNMASLISGALMTIMCAWLGIYLLWKSKSS